MSSHYYPIKSELSSNKTHAISIIKAASMIQYTIRKSFGTPESVKVESRKLQEQTEPLLDDDEEPLFQVNESDIDNEQNLWAR